MFLGEIDQEALNKAFEHLNKSLQLNSKNSETFLKIGIYYKLSGDLSKYKLYIEKAIDIDPNYIEAMKLLEELE